MVNAQWSQPIILVDGARHNLIDFAEELRNIPDKPGVYVFARRHGQKVSPIYIGQAEKLRTRIEQQFNSVPLMVGMPKRLTGDKDSLIY